MSIQLRAHKQRFRSALLCLRGDHSGTCDAMMIAMLNLRELSSPRLDRSKQGSCCHILMFGAGRGSTAGEMAMQNLPRRSFRQMQATVNSCRRQLWFLVRKIENPLGVVG